MTARDTIAHTLLASVDLTMAEVDDPSEVLAAAAELIAAVRAMPVEEQAELIGMTQVGWLGPYGIVPGGMDNNPAPWWQPIYAPRGNR